MEPAVEFGKSQVPGLLEQVCLDLSWGLVAGLPIRRDYCSLPIETTQGSRWVWRLNPRPREALDLLQQQLLCPRVRLIEVTGERVGRG